MRGSAGPWPWSTRPIPGRTQTLPAKRSIATSPAFATQRCQVLSTVPDRKRFRTRRRQPIRWAWTRWRPLHRAMPRSDPVRDALAVLGVDLAAKHEAVASSAEPVTQSRRPASAGGSAPVAKRTALGSGETGSFDGPDLPGDVPDIAATSIKVMRQETHFQPVAHEARRLLGMTAGAPGERTLPPTLAAAAKIARPQALQRASEDPPAIADRVTEAAGSNAPIALAADGSTLGGVGQQIADGIQRAMDAPADPATPRSTPSLDPAAPPAFAPAIRSIKLQLNPHSLGVVTIMLTGSDGDLRIHLEAERAETIGKVEQERGALSARLNGAGYAISELTVGRMGAADTQGRDGDPKDAAARQGGQTGGQHRRHRGRRCAGRRGTVRRPACRPSFRRARDSHERGGGIGREERRHQSGCIRRVVCRAVPARLSGGVGRRGDCASTRATFVIVGRCFPGRRAILSGCRKVDRSRLGVAPPFRPA